MTKPSVFPEPEKLPSRPEWPDPLETFAGGKITTAAEWNSQRRPELAELFRHYMYGYEPPAPDNVKFSVREDRSWLNGKAVLREYAVSYGPAGTPGMSLLVVRPAGRPGPWPIFLGVNFNGNDAVRNGEGNQGAAWPADLIVSKGFGFATFHCADMDPDKPDFTDGVHPLYFQPGQTAPGPTDWGTISAWAWGLSRAADVLLKTGETDADRLCVIGHSRLGKTALLAAARDPRFALAVPNQAGCGGTAPSRGTVGESVKSINENFPHWFNDIFPQFGDAVDRLPFDQHALVALVAPRPALFLAAEEDQWANPAGQFDVLRAASPVYRLLGSTGIMAEKMPAVNVMVGGTLGYRLRPGPHYIGEKDWADAISFASARLPAARR